MKPVGFKFCARRTRQERKRDRLHVVLCDAAITKEDSGKIFQWSATAATVFGRNQTSRQLDQAISDWIQKAWEDGESLHIVNDSLCGLHHYEPWTKYRIPLAWIFFFKVWRKVAVAHRDLPFYDLLRTGELLQVCARDIMAGEKAAIVSLKNTKTGLRNAGSGHSP